MKEALKQDQIIEVAIRRFSHFGIGKTTLTEIADDLALSKQSLAHYFPDKQSLVSAVGDRISSQYLQTLDSEMGKATSVASALDFLTRIKKEYFRKYFMLAMESAVSEVTTQSNLMEVKQKLRQGEETVLIALLDKGRTSGELNKIDSGKMAGLLLDTLHAFSLCLKDSKLFHDDGQIEEVFEKQKEVIGIFYQGLRNRDWQN